ncbi:MULTISPECIES: hypothetical protein [unclassified Agrococcus]|uniref:hypothetical protein n=1 Tax=unclassified Agrococcus TaxID=2615065 RepID=UPI00360935D1
MQAIVDGYDGTPERASFTGPTVDFVKFMDAGISLRFNAKRLSSVFIYALDDDGFTPYADTTGFIDGIDFASSDRKDVRAVLGEPYRSEENFDLFRIQDGRVVHVTFDEGLIWKIVVMARDVSER